MTNPKSSKQMITPHSQPSIFVRGWRFLFGQYSVKQSLPATLLLLLVVALMLTPILVIFNSWFTPISADWQHIYDYLLPDAIKNTLLLLIIVSIGAGFLGTYLAWITSAYDFTGQRLFRWGLMLPMAMPAYVLAFVSVGFVEYTGPLQTWMRSIGISWGIGSIRHIWGAGVILSLVFYPYVYLLARQAFLTQGRRAIEAGQMLGLTQRQAFFKVALPQAKPWIVGGLVIAGMETVADFGAVAVFNVNTFTTAIYKVWFSLYNLDAAAQLASLLVMVVLIGVMLEQYWQNKRHYTASHGKTQRIRLTGINNIIAFTCCSIIFTLAFLLPVIQLLWWSWQNIADLDNRYIGFVLNTVIIASLTAIVLACVATLVAWIKRRFPNRLHQSLVALSNLGYAVPGTVLAVGVLLPIASIDNWLINSGITSSQLLSGSILIMLLALMTRFFAVSFQPIDRQLQRLTPSQEQAVLLLTDSKWQRWRGLILPILKSGILTALLMGFVEVMKEMPITLMTRRQGWDTLAVRVFEMTSEGMWARAALPSLFIIIVGLLPVWWLIRQSEKDE